MDLDVSKCYKALFYNIFIVYTNIFVLNFLFTVFQEAFSGLDSPDDVDDSDITDSSDESENDFELIEDVFKKKKAERKARMKVSKKTVEQPKQLSRAERFKIREKLLQEVKSTRNRNVKESGTRNTRNSNSQNENTKDEKNQSGYHSRNFSNSRDFTKMKCFKNKCQNIHTISKVLDNRILSVPLEKLSDNVFNMNDVLVTDKNGHCIQNVVNKESAQTNLLKKTKNNSFCKISAEKTPKKFCEKSDCQKQQSVVKISGSCQKMVKEVRKGLFGDPVGALIQICLEKLPLDLCVQGSVNLLDQKSCKFFFNFFNKQNTFVSFVLVSISV